MSYIGNGNFAPPPGGNRDHGIRLRDVAIVSFTLAVFVTALRISARIFIVRKVGWDDWTMALSIAVAAVQISFILECIASGGGRHEYYLDKEQKQAVTKWNFLSQLPLVVLNCLTKLSICFLIISITNCRFLVRYMWALMITLIVVNGAAVVELLVQCRPIQAFWDFTIRNACWNWKIMTDMSWLQGVTSVVTDLICTCLPIIILWNIKISFRQKLAIYGLMASGLITTACSIVRIYKFGTFTSFVDSSYTLTTEIWLTLEQNIGIIAANMPIMRPIYHLTTEKVPAYYGSLKSMIRGTKSDRADAMSIPRSASTSGFHKLTVSKEIEDSENTLFPRGGSDEMEMPLKPLVTKKAAAQFVEV